MQPIKAVSLTYVVKDWLENSRYPRVLHVFDSACNLINERREVLSIVTPQIGNGPFNLVVEEDVCFADHLDLESPISISPTQLHLGDFTANTTDATLWNPRLDWKKLHAHKNNILQRLMKLPITNHQLPIPNPQFSNSLISSIVTADIHSSKTFAGKLAGLGIGLTPAGDDFLMGALYAAWIIHPSEIASVLAKEIAETAAPLTTSLSAAWIRSAGRGEAGIVWHEFFDALILGSSDLQSPISKILAVGETSGADALSGFLSVTTTFKERIIGGCLS